MNKTLLGYTWSWLHRLSPDTAKTDPFPLKEILRASLFCPCSRFDEDPVRHFSHAVQSFVYVDTSHTQAQFDEVLCNPVFQGYEVLIRRDVTRCELASHEWQPPSCTWVVLQRLPEMPISHGPERISLLHLGEDAVTAYHALYIRNHCKPAVLALTQTGFAFPGSLTNLTDPNAMFARLVLGNPAGRPATLLYGGIGRRNFYRTPCWPHYSSRDEFFDKSDGGTIAVWHEK